MPNCPECNREGEHWFACPLKDKPAPYTGPIWKEPPTLEDYLLLPVQLAWMGATTAALATTCFLLNPSSFFPWRRRHHQKAEIA